MANNDVATTPSADNRIENVSIRVIALAHATNQNEDAYLSVNIDSTVAQLKDRIHETLNQHPTPESQRLIYHGRPLTNSNATLRQILRTEHTGSDEPPAHVLHLVIRDDRSPANPSNNQSQSVRSVPPSTNPTGPPHPGPTPTPPNLAFPQQAFAPVQSAQALHNHLNAIQQHLAIHNQHLHQHNHPMPNLQQHLPGHNALPFNGRQGPGTSTSTPTPQDIPPSASPMPAAREASTNPPGPQTQTIENPVNFHGAMNVRFEETIGPNGERIRRVTHSGPLLPGHNNPVERSFSAPGFAPRPGTNGRFPAGPFPPVPIGLPGMPPPHIRLPPPPLSSAPMMPSAPMRNPTLWLLSSPSGPEALLFTPQHGYFSSQQQTTTQSNVQTNGNVAENPAQPSQSLPTTTPTPTSTAPAQDDVRGPNQGQLALRPQHPAQEPAPVPPVRRDGEDVLAIVLQRGWLFLRLYMFIFVLSEAGTWRRYILLTIASLVCLLPRNNPLTDMFQAARQHFDNLIGPPQLPANAQGQQQQPANRNDENGPSNRTPNSQGAPPRDGSGAQMPSPEEHARRLLREHEQRNPSFVRDFIYRIEQAIALFLASLIPGVGERHVRAREEARRVVQEDERRRREEEERAQQESNDTSIKTDSLPAHESGSSASAEGTAVSTSVDTSAASPPATGTDDGVRMRATENAT